jgi:hypothetical protein
MAKSGGVRRTVWEPHAGPQTALFQMPADFILYGGAKGGGKTDALLIMAVRDYDKPGYKAILFRRTFPELERHIILRSHELFSGIGQYDSRNHRWRFRCPGGGESVIEFAYMEQESDVFKYQGSEYARVLFDESTHFSENQVRMMMTCLRSPVEGVRRQMILASNPVGPGYGWHYKLFFEYRKPGRVYHDAVWPSDGRSIGVSTCFIPARVWDNPTLLKRDPEYPARLRGQSEAVARALLDGSWAESIGLAFDFDPLVHTMEPIELPSWATRWIGMDWGKDDEAAAVWQAADEKHVYWTRDHCRPGKLIRPYAQEIIDISKQAGESIQYVVLSHECFADRGMGHTQADQFIDEFHKAEIPVLKSDKDHIGRVMLLREYLRTTKLADELGTAANFEYWVERFQRDTTHAAEEYARLMASRKEVDLPRLKIFRFNGKLGCPHVINSLPLLQVDAEEPRHLAEGQNDHAFDAGTYGLKAYVGGAQPPVAAYYSELLDGRIPDSTFGLELAMEEAQRRAEVGDEDLKPLRWRSQPFE